MFGWATGVDESPATVHVLCDGADVGVASARLWRADLQAAGIGDGRHGFEFTLPENVRARGTYTVEVAVAGVPLCNSPFTVREETNPFGSGRRFFRRFVAAQFCSGDGLEIGALHRPMPLPPGVRVRYVDSLSTADLQTVWRQEVEGHRLANVDIVTDATTLSAVADESMDFVVASHVIEHIEDPIRAISNFVRVLRQEGTVLLIVPNRHYTFDVNRPPTSIEHVFRDHCAGPAWSRRAHYEEWVHVVENINAPQAARARIDELERSRYAIHFHVWNPSEFTALIAEVRRLSSIPFDVVFFAAHVDEAIWVLKRKSQTSR